MHRICNLLFAAAAAVLSITTAGAAPPGALYVAVDAVRADLGHAQDTGVFQGPLTGTDLGLDTGARIAAGLRLSDHLAIELGYADLADVEGEAEVFTGAVVPGAGPLFLSVPMELQLGQVDVTAVATLPVGRRFALEALAGYARTRVEFTSKGGAADYPRLRGLTYGFGVVVELSEAFALRARAQRFDKDDRPDYVTLGFVYRLPATGDASLRP